jgi:hypothetical protein
MTSQSEAVWQSWQRIQRLYSDPAVRAARTAVSAVVYTQQEQDQDPYDDLGQLFLEEVDKQNAVVGADLADNLSILKKLVGQTCTIKFARTYHGNGYAEQCAERVTVIESGLEACGRISRYSLSVCLKPLITVAGNVDHLPPWQIGTSAPGEATYGWQNIHAIRIHQPNDPDLILDD